MKVNIAILEDELLIALDIERVLKKLDLNVIGKVSNSKGLYALSKDNQIDILITDISINDNLTGIELAKYMQNSYGTRIIFLTSFSDDKTLEEASCVDYDGYLLKPFRDEDLKVLVNLTIKKYSLDNKYTLIKINEFHSYSQDTKILYLNEKELYLSPKEKIVFSRLFLDINSAVSYEEFDFSLEKKKEIVSSLNLKLKGLGIKNLKDEKSFILCFK